MPSEQPNMNRRKPGKLLAKSLAALMFVGLTAWLTIPAMLEHKSNTCTTVLTLKAEACHYLGHEGISTRPVAGTDAVCLASVLFSQSMIGSSGEIHLGERRLRIADNQIVATEALLTPGQAEAQVHAFLWILFCTAALIGMMGWLVAMTFEYIEVFYNRKRLHSTPGYKSAQHYLEDWLNAQQQEKLVA